MKYYEMRVGVKPRSDSHLDSQALSIFRMMSICRLPFLAQYIMELTFTQAAKGVNKEMSVNIDASCQRCDGKGHEPGTKVQHCHYCNGSGMVRAPTPSSHVSQSTLCAVLLNTGLVPTCRRQ